MQLLQGKQLAEILLKQLKEKISALEVKPRLAIIQIGDEIPSNVSVSYTHLDVYKRQGILLQHKVENLKTILHKMYNLWK